MSCCGSCQIEQRTLYYNSQEKTLLCEKCSKNPLPTKQEFVDTETDKKICSKHSRPFEFYCPSCEKKICPSSVIEHSSHKLVTLKDQVEEMVSRMETQKTKIFNDISIVQGDIKKIQQDLDEKKKQLQKLETEMDEIETIILNRDFDSMQQEYHTQLIVKAPTDHFTFEKIQKQTRLIAFLEKKDTENHFKHCLGHLSMKVLENEYSTYESFREELLKEMNQLKKKNPSMRAYIESLKKCVGFVGTGIQWTDYIIPIIRESVNGISYKDLISEVKKTIPPIEPSIKSFLNRKVSNGFITFEQNVYRIAEKRKDPIQQESDVRVTRRRSRETQNETPKKKRVSKRINYDENLIDDTSNDFKPSKDRFIDENLIEESEDFEEDSDDSEIEDDISQ